MKSPITTHVLDTSRGRPAEGVPVELQFRRAGEDWAGLAKGVTDRDGRIGNLLPPEHKLAAGFYRLKFDTGSYFRAIGAEAFYPCVAVMFEIKDPAQHYHVPLLLNPFGYSTYRGS